VSVEVGVARPMWVGGCGEVCRYGWGGAVNVGVSVSVGAVRWGCTVTDRRLHCRKTSLMNFGHRVVCDLAN
jgi:hypothetical protein